MKITVIGAGYVGLVSAACFSDFGYEVTCVDRDARKVAALESGKIPIYEQGLEPVVASNRQAGRLTFTEDLKSAVAAADVVLIAVGTPTREGEDAADLSYVYAAGEEIATRHAGLYGDRHQVDGAGGHRGEAPRDHLQGPARWRFRRGLQPRIHARRFGGRGFPAGRTGWWSASIPSAPRRCCASSTGRSTAKNVPLLVTSCEAAEVIKYAANTFLATRIAFVNQLADLCEKVGADIQDVARGMGLDKRIGLQFLNPGPGFGGSCFPKDTRALVHTARQHGNPFTIVENVVAANEARKRALADRIQQAVGGTLAGKKIALLGIAFKAETDDIRDAAALTVIPELQKRGAAARRLRSRGHGQWPPGLPVGAVVCRCLFGGDRRRCGGDPHRMERVPRPRPEAPRARHARSPSWSISATSSRSATSRAPASPIIRSGAPASCRRRPRRPPSSPSSRAAV